MSLNNTSHFPNFHLKDGGSLYERFILDLPPNQDASRFIDIPSYVYYCFSWLFRESLFRGETPISCAEPSENFRGHHRCNKQMFRRWSFGRTFSDRVLSVTADVLDMKSWLIWLARFVEDFETRKPRCGEKKKKWYYVSGQPHFQNYISELWVRVGLRERGMVLQDLLFWLHVSGPVDFGNHHRRQYLLHSCGLIWLYCQLKESMLSKKPHL